MDKRYSMNIKKQHNNKRVSMGGTACTEIWDITDMDLTGPI